MVSLVFDARTRQPKLKKTITGNACNSGMGLGEETEPKVMTQAICFGNQVSMTVMIFKLRNFQYLSVLKRENPVDDDFY